MNQDEFDNHIKENIAFKNNTVSIVGNSKSGIMCFFSNDNPIGATLIANGEWAGQELDFFDKILTDTSNCIDIGANIGTHTTWLSHRCKNGVIYSIEPQFFIFQILNTNIVLNSCMNVIPINAFIGNDSGNILAQIINPFALNRLNYGEFNKENALWSQLANTTDDNSNLFLPFKKKTPIIRLDELDIFTPIDFIKIDCEGFENDVLLSGAELIKKFKPYMYIEYNTLTASSGNRTTITLLKEYGYNCYWHITTKHNPHNFRNTSSVWTEVPLTVDYVSMVFEGNIICIHEDKDTGLFSDKLLDDQDTMIEWLLRNDKIQKLCT